MRVAENQLFADAVGHAVQVKTSAFPLHLRMEGHLEQHVSQLLPEMLAAALVDGLHRLVGLLQKIAADGLVGLLRVPGASPRGSEDSYNFLQILDSVRILILKIYHISRPPATHNSKKLSEYAKSPQFYLPWA